MEILLNLNKLLTKSHSSDFDMCSSPLMDQFFCVKILFFSCMTDENIKKTFLNIKNEISSECWENWILCFIDLKVSESPIMLLLVPNWRAYLALWLVNSLSFISTTKVTLGGRFSKHINGFRGRGELFQTVQWFSGTGGSKMNQWFFNVFQG